MNISFGGSYINSSNVLKKTKDGYKPEEVSFVELSYDDKFDSKTIKDISEIWDNSYAMFINQGDSSKIPKGYKRHVYVICEKASNYKNVNPDKVLCVALFDEGKFNTHLDLLQSKPNSVTSEVISPEYKKTGTAMIDSLKNLYNDKPMKVFSDYHAIGFYEKCGFKQDIEEGSKNAYVWNV